MLEAEAKGSIPIKLLVATAIKSTHEPFLLRCIVVLLLGLRKNTKIWSTSLAFVGIWNLNYIKYSFTNVNCMFQNVTGTWHACSRDATACCILRKGIGKICVCRIAGRSLCKLVVKIITLERNPSNSQPFVKYHIFRFHENF